MKEQLIKSKVHDLKDNLINSICESVKIPSVNCDNEGNSPFGIEIDNCLKQTLSLCEDLGFKTFYGDGYYGYAEIGTGEELIGILGHLDVVPSGDESTWIYPPFEPTVVDNKIYGRGTQDDKGPTIAAIYAVKALLDSGIEFNKRVRFIFGTDEETLWRGINKYIENGEEIPCCGFAPDSQFPLINAEKGLLQALLVSNKGSDITLSAGNAFNAVPDTATYSGDKFNVIKNELDKLNFDYEIINDNTLSVKGTALHSQVCDKGINAISRLCIALNNIGVNSDAIKFIADVIGEDGNANNIVPNCQDDVSGKLTFNIGKIDLNPDNQTISLDIRIPVTFQKEDVVSPLVKIANKYGLEYKEFDWLKSIYIPADNFLVKSLRKVYEQETNLDSTPLSSGGATYARALDNCVAFGMVFPHTPKVEHQPNEFILIDDLMKATEIYALSIYELLK